MFSEQRSNMLHGVLLIALFSCAAFYIGDSKFFKEISISPMIIGIVLGMIYANSLRNHLPVTWVPGIQFCAKKILRLGIILYGFRLTFQDVTAVGLPGILVDLFIVVTTIFGGVYIGKLLKMDKELTLLTSIGSGICGAAAVLGAESTIQTKPFKTAVAVATVVIYGTISMFIYPSLYKSGFLAFSPDEMGIFTGATLHEVAHTVGAGNSMGQEISNTAVIVKMIRVMMLVPVLLILGYWAAKNIKRDDTHIHKNAGHKDHKIHSEESEQNKHQHLSAEQKSQPEIEIITIDEGLEEGNVIHTDFYKEGHGNNENQNHNKEIRHEHKHSHQHKDENVEKSEGKKKNKVVVPWFAFGFLIIIGFNSLDLVPRNVITVINDIDTFLLTMAMVALGTETSIDKFKQAGAKPFILAFILDLWLIGGGYFAVKAVSAGL